MSKATKKNAPESKGRLIKLQVQLSY